MTSKELIEKAKKKVSRLRKLRKDLRYIRTMGKLRHAGILDVRDVAEYRGQVFLEEALWAARVEPRILELLPAILVRRPKLFAYLEIPKDLETVVRELRAGRAQSVYQGIPPEKYERWINRVGRKKTRPKVMRSFRLHLSEVEILDQVAKKRNLSQAEVIAQALSALIR